MKELKSLLVIGVLVAILVPQVKTQEGERVPTNEVENHLEMPFLISIACCYFHLSLIA